MTQALPDIMTVQYEDKDDGLVYFHPAGPLVVDGIRYDGEQCTGGPMFSLWHGGYGAARMRYDLPPPDEATIRRWMCDGDDFDLGGHQ